MLRLRTLFARAAQKAFVQLSLRQSRWFGCRLSLFVIERWRRGAISAASEPLTLERALPTMPALSKMKARISVLSWMLAMAFAAGAEPVRRTGIAAIANEAIVTIQEVDMASSVARDGLIRAY